MVQRLGSLLIACIVCGLIVIAPRAFSRPMIVPQTQQRDTVNPAFTNTPTSTIPPGYMPLIVLQPTLTPTATPTETPAPTPTRDPALCAAEYPTVCIPPPPPDLDCPDIPYTNFTVLPPDRHRFDADHDGIGCEA